MPLSKARQLATVFGDQGDNGFWPDVTPTAQVWKVRDRVFINDGAAFTGNSTGTQGGFVPTSTQGANWASVGSMLFVASQKGQLAVTGFVSNENSNPAASTASIGVSGFVINKLANKSVWGLYSDVQYEAGLSARGLEIAVKNKSGMDTTATSYVASAGACGIWLPAGGDSSYGGSPTNPNNYAIGIGTNSSTWNKGIVFFKDGLTGSDGTTGTATAIEMAKGHSIVWRNNGGTALTIRSDSTSGVNDIFLISTNSTFKVAGIGEQAIAEFIFNSNAVNSFQFSNGSTGNAPLIRATGSDTNIQIWYYTKGTAAHRFASQNSLANEEFRIGGVNSAPVNFLRAYGTNAGAGNAIIDAIGTDTNISIRLTPKGTGTVQFGTWTSNADAAVNGYVTITDSSGNTRKLATIA